MKKQLGVVGFTMFMSLLGIEAIAQNHISALLRDEYALGLTPTIKSAGMGGAYLGVDRVSSMNPAALGGIEQIEGTLNYGLYDSNSGPTAHRGRLDVALHDPISDYIADWFPALGFMKTMGTRIMVDGFATDGSAETRIGGMEAEYDSVTIGSHFGIDLFDWLSVGGGAYPYEAASISMSGPAGTWNGDALSQLGSNQFGVLVKPCQYFNIGGEFIYIQDHLQFSGTTIAGTPGTIGDMYYIRYYGIGTAIMPFDGTLLALDYWTGEAEGLISRVPHVKFDKDIDRWNFGVEQRVCQYCDLRLGSNNGGLTAGFTIHINEKMEVDYAYVNQALRDKEDAFGDTQYHGLAFTMRF